MKILFAVSGSISAYKSIDIVRGLVKNGHQVQVVLTEGAKKFVVPQLFSYLGAENVYSSQDDFNHKNVLHVDLARWCDILVIAPLSANTLSRLARGEATDLLTSIFLALEPHKNCLVFPAMNTNMLHHPFTEENLRALKKLKSLNNIFISPTDSGILACAEIGEGKLPSVDEIINLIPTFVKPLSDQCSKTLLITTGATIVPLDPVRYLTNSSSGITGFHLAKVALELGYKVEMIAGFYATSLLDHFQKHPNYNITRVKTVSEMKEVVAHKIGSAHAYISSAAISDIEFATSPTKVKKEHLTESLPITKAEDILKYVIGLKSQHLKIVGFAAETDLSDEVLLKKMTSKPVHLLIGTKVHNGLLNNEIEAGFNTSSAYYKIINSHQTLFEGELSKEELAKKILHTLFPALYPAST
jgi:phosphopantothenoylcysteine decarboxylase/phosphopantothenate--cysteine ligase